MATLHNLKPEKVIKVFERVGWINKGQKGSHVKLVKEEGGPVIISILVHKGKKIEIGLKKLDDPV